MLELYRSQNSSLHKLYIHSFHIFGYLIVYTIRHGVLILAIMYKIYRDRKAIKMKIIAGKIAQIVYFLCVYSASVCEFCC